VGKIAFSCRQTYADFAGDLAHAERLRVGIAHLVSGLPHGRVGAMPTLPPLRCGYGNNSRKPTRLEVLPLKKMRLGSRHKLGLADRPQLHC
jgi:hypothetical protein